MRYLPLIWRNLLRRKVRTIFTLASVFIAFVLYGFLMVVQNAFSMGVEVAGVDRLVLMHKVSLIQLLPVSLRQTHPRHRGRHARRLTRRGSAAPIRTRRISSRSWPSIRNISSCIRKRAFPTIR